MQRTGSRGPNHTWTKAAVAITSLFGYAQAVTGQCIGHEEQELTASDGVDADFFGKAVAVSGNVALVGAANRDDAGANSGAVYVYRFDGTTWLQEQRLNASDATPADSFGTAVAVWGNVAVVGAVGTSAAYAFRYDGTTWLEEQKLIASGPAASDGFGSSVAVTGNAIVVGAPRDDDLGSNSGSAYLFLYDGLTWVEEDKFTASDGAADDWFGHSVSASGPVAVIGAPYHDLPQTDSGAMYIYRYDGTSMVEEQKLTASDATADDWFGYSVSLSGNLALVGAPFDDGTGVDSGSAYVYRWDGTTWLEEQELISSNAASADLAGWSVAVSGRTAVVGAWADDDTGVGSGSAYIYQFDGTSMVEEQKLLASDGVEWDAMGQSVAVSEDVAVVGAYLDEAGGMNRGSAYVFRITDLALQASPDTVVAGDTLTFTTCGGLAGGGVLLAAVTLDAAPVFIPLAIGAFDGSNQWVLAPVVPAGLSGITAEFQSFGFYQPGRVGNSNRARVSFQ